MSANGIIPQINPQIVPKASLQLCVVLLLWASLQLQLSVVLVLWGKTIARDCSIGVVIISDIVEFVFDIVVPREIVAGVIVSV